MFDCCMILCSACVYSILLCSLDERDIPSKFGGFHAAWNFSVIA